MERSKNNIDQNLNKIDVISKGSYPVSKNRNNQERLARRHLQRRAAQAARRSKHHRDTGRV
jgi:hypothetical protein